jgi:hypothetical protein
LKLSGSAFALQTGSYLLPLNDGYCLDKAPRSPEFIDTRASAPGLKTQLLARYRALASHSQFSESNAFALALPGMDLPLAATIGEGDAFHMVAAVARGAMWTLSGRWNRRTRNL